MDDHNQDVPRASYTELRQASCTLIPKWNERKYVFFFRKHHECGEDQKYESAPGTA